MCLILLLTFVESNITNQFVFSFSSKDKQIVLFATEVLFSKTSAHSLSGGRISVCNVIEKLAEHGI